MGNKPRKSKEELLFKRSQYQKKYFANIAASVTKEEAAAFRAVCKSGGETINNVLREYMRACIKARRILQPSAERPEEPEQPEDQEREQPEQKGQGRAEPPPAPPLDYSADNVADEPPPLFR